VNTVPYKYDIEGSWH